MKLPILNQPLSCRRGLLVLCLLALIANLLVFWPNVRQYANDVAHDYQSDGGKRLVRKDATPLVETSANKSLATPSKVTVPLVYGEGGEKDKKEETKSNKEQEEEEQEPQLPACPDVPPDLVGALAGFDKEISKEEVERRHRQGSPEFTEMSLGGKSQPATCSAKQSLAIVIPYRNRYAHLHILLNNLIPILRRQQRDFQIFVIEQNMPTVFNRGMLFNVGFLEALKFQEFDCFVFHDVDMLPLNDHALYECKNKPVHLAAWTSKWAGGLPYKKYFGGVVMFSKSQFAEINGDSNLYFGWGGEDDDLWSRVKSKGYTPIRYPQQIGRYKMIKHKRDSGNEADKSRFALLNNAGKRIDQDGISTAVYDVTSIEVLPLYTWVKVTLDKNVILKDWNPNGTPKNAPKAAKA